MDTKLFSVKDTEEILNLGHTKVCELIADGDIASIKIGRRRLVTPESIDRFIASREAGEPTVSDLRRLGADPDSSD